MKNFLILLLAFTFTGCSYSKPLDFPELDAKAFKSDRGGCNGTRASQLELIRKNKDRFLSLNENVIFKTLGRYDYEVLSKRTQKVFVYYLEPGPQCERIQNPTEAEALLLYFNSAKLVNQVVIQKGGYKD